MMEIELEGLCMEERMTKKMSNATTHSQNLWEDYSG